MKLFILFFAILFTHNVFAFVVSDQFTTTASVVSTELLDFNRERSFLYIQNQGSQEVSVKFATVQSAEEGVKIAAGESLEWAPAPIDSVYLRTATLTSGVRIIEGTR